MSPQNLVRDAVHPDIIKILSTEIQKNYPEFDMDNFNNAIIPKLPGLGLNERLDLVTNELYRLLPKDFQQSSQILIDSLEDELPNEKSSLDGVDLNGYSGFIVVALTNYIARYGQDNFEISMNALAEMTKRFSSEGAIRHFLVADESNVHAVMKEWANSDNVHLRRLVSEGLRPRLPWTIRLKQYVDDPTPILPFLEILKDDPELYVRRSVANNLNDISKDHPDVVTTILKRWNKKGSKEMTRMTKHALRTLLKSGDREALNLLGFTTPPKISVNSLTLEKKSISLGNSLEFSFQIKSTSEDIQNLLIDYIIYHKKANGTQSPKVFKLGKKKIKGNESVELNKKHAIKNISTRKYYSGEHKIVLQINGELFEECTFQLLIDE